MIFACKLADVNQQIDKIEKPTSQQARGIVALSDKL
jgi:hypothetical protein